MMQFVVVTKEQAWWSKPRQITISILNDMVRFELGDYEFLPEEFYKIIAEVFYDMGQDESVPCKVYYRFSQSTETIVVSTGLLGNKQFSYNTYGNRDMVTGTIVVPRWGLRKFIETIKKSTFELGIIDIQFDTELRMG